MHQIYIHDPDVFIVLQSTNIWQHYTTLLQYNENNSCYRGILDGQICPVLFTIILFCFNTRIMSARKQPVWGRNIVLDLYLLTKHRKITM